MTSREAAAIAYGEAAAAAYELVKRFYTRYGYALERTFAAAVGGRLGRKGRKGEHGEPDVITSFGAFEFCAQRMSKNAAGRERDKASVWPEGVVRVQVAERPIDGRISGEEFLRLHGVGEPERVAAECQVAAMWEAVEAGVQLRVPL
jgi:hypothetical protein